MSGRGNHIQRSAILAFLFWASAAAMFGVTNAAADVAGVATRDLGPNPDGIERSWTRGSMRAARPIDSNGRSPDARTISPSKNRSVDSALLSSGPFLPEDASAYPFRLHGRIFFRFQGSGFSCSGTLISSRGRNVVLTAGHCVWIRAEGGIAGWAEDLVFVPGYDGNSPDVDPFGIFPATALSVRNEYRAGLNYGVDFAFLTVAGTPESELGARKIAFGLDPADRPETIFGYPAFPSPPYNGEDLVGCESAVLGRDIGAGLPTPLKAGPCNMGSGASGGGWVTGSGYVNSVTSYGYCNGSGPGCSTIYGPFLADQARSLYSSEGIGGSAPPRTTITTNPPNSRSGVVRISLRGSGSTPLAFRCRLDRAPFKACSRSRTLKGLSRGRHVLRAFAVDQTGLRGPVSAAAFRVG